jgi:putative tryptophan/tyrosine transport system substrate-binding protein
MSILLCVFRVLYVFLAFFWAFGAAAAPMADVLYLDPAGNPARDGIQPFQSAYERHIRPRHPTATFEHRTIQADTPERIAESVRPERIRPPKLIFTADTRIAQVVARELPGVPMVFLTLADPVTLGVSDDPIAPRANITGYTSNTPVDLKHVEILLQCKPSIRRVGVVSDHAWANVFTAGQLLSQSESLFGVAVRLVRIESTADIQNLAQIGLTEKYDAWFVPDTPFNRVHYRQIADQIRISGKPWIAGYRSPTALLAYAPERFNPWDRIGEMMSLVLSGVPAREIPFERPKRFELIVNRTTARALGVIIPRSLLVRANVVVD